MYSLTLFLHGSKVITRAVTNFRTLTRTSCPFYGWLTPKHRPEETHHLDFFHSKKYMMLWIIYDIKKCWDADCLVLNNCTLLFLKHDFLKAITSYIQASTVYLEKHLCCVLPCSTHTAAWPVALHLHNWHCSYLSSITSCIWIEKSLGWSGLLDWSYTGRSPRFAFQGPIPMSPSSLETWADITGKCLCESLQGTEIFPLRNCLIFWNI